MVSALDRTKNVNCQRSNRMSNNFRAVVLKAQSPDQQHEHHLGICEQCKFSGPSLYFNNLPEDSASLRICFRQASQMEEKENVFLGLMEFDGFVVSFSFSFSITISYSLQVYPFFIQQANICFTKSYFITNTLSS